MGVFCIGDADVRLSRRGSVVTSIDMEDGERQDDVEELGLCACSSNVYRRAVDGKLSVVGYRPLCVRANGGVIGSASMRDVVDADVDVSLREGEEVRDEFDEFVLWIRCFDGVCRRFRGESGNVNEEEDEERDVGERSCGQ
jgi:hypothetical protein